MIFCMCRLARSSWLRALVAGGALTAIWACTSSQPTAPAGASGSWSVSPDTLRLSDIRMVDTLVLESQSTSDLNWSIKRMPTWLHLSDSAGVLPAQGESRITVVADTSGVLTGVYFGRIELETALGRGDVITYLFNNAHPVLRVSEALLTLDDTTTQIQFEIANTGTGLLDWTLSASEGWLDLTPDSGRTARNQSAMVTAIVDRTHLPAGVHTAYVQTTSNSDSAEALVAVEMSVPSYARLDVLTDSVFFNYFVDSGSVVITNQGNAALNWSVVVDPAYFEVQPTGGVLAGSDTITASLLLSRRDTLETGSFHVRVIVTADSGQLDTVSCGISHFKDTKWIVADSLIDAEYDGQNDVIVAASLLPRAVFVIDPFQRVVDTIPLMWRPLSVSISPDGNTAAVGHDNALSLVDLTTGSVIREFALNVLANDVVLGGTGWAYVFPGLHSWTGIRSINLATGDDVNQIGPVINGFTKGRLHPSGLWIYGANNGNLEHYSISQDTAHFVWRGLFFPGMGGNVWCDASGQRIFSEGGIFTASDVYATDMREAGSLSLGHPTGWLSINAAVDRIALIRNRDLREFRTYTSATLTPVQVHSLSSYIVPTPGGGAAFGTAIGKYVFINSAGTHYVVVQYIHPQGTGPSEEWAIDLYTIGTVGSRN